ncbi:uncharacterized protein LOC117143406 [Drosophila mauritiana]|uniref:Uncharacterized protein LOC117143406 n=1 Tax=Drosophila mauritiana TaxID=7226 RepID=A0A6P8KKS1_DROMA|nr:uncharacterized protein LOC117143406 [Drosophila mauritiana]
MSKAKSTPHEPTIHYLDSVLSDEEKRCAYGHQWRNFSISRSGRFRSKNKKRDAVDGKFFDGGSGSLQDIEKVSNCTSKSTSKCVAPATGPMTPSANQARSQRDQVESYKSVYETNL